MNGYLASLTRSERARYEQLCWRYPTDHFRQALARLLDPKRPRRAKR